MSDDSPAGPSGQERTDDGSDRRAPAVDEGPDRRAPAVDGGRQQPPVTDEDDLPMMATQFYRAEQERASTWRTRLDQTTNWAVVVMAAILTWAFSSPDNPHYVLLIGLLAIGAFLVIEAERYQEYDAWRSRVRSLQQDLFAPAFDPDSEPRDGWRHRLGQDLRSPEIHVPLWQAIAHRLSHVYFLLLSVLVAAWLVRITVFQTGESWARTAGVAFVPGIVVVAVVAAVYLAAAVLTVWSTRRAPKREFEDDVRTDVSSGSD